MVVEVDVGAAGADFTGLHRCNSKFEVEVGVGAARNFEFEIAPTSTSTSN
jgi:hypothetical protein